MNDVPTSRWTQPHPDYSDGRKFFCGASSQIRDDIGIWWAATWSHFRKLFEVVFVTGDTVMSILAGWSLRYRCCEARPVLHGLGNRKSSAWSSSSDRKAAALVLDSL
jgi:hypothetical protein